MDPRPFPVVTCIAHRGFADERAENTVGALVAAAGVADFIEFDVRRCGSGELVVFHDETVGRVTDGTGRVEDLTRSELAGLDVLDSGEGIPTLREVLEAIPSTAGINVELKENGLAADVADELTAHGGSILLSSFDASILAELSVVTDDPLALIVDGTPNARLERALELGCVAIHPHWDLCDESFVTRAQDAGLDVNVWTIRDNLGAISARSAGVDGLITDYRHFCGS